MRPIQVDKTHSDTLKLDGALLIYGGRYVTHHGIIHHKDRAPELTPGRPLERRELAHLLRAAGQDIATASGCWVDPRMVYITPGTIAWVSPSGPRHMFFQTSYDEGKALRNRAGLASQPALLWAVAGGRWFVWALADEARPGPGTPVFHAPYFNVYETGEICAGNAKVPREISAATMDGFERAFFDSRFTHPNAKSLTNWPGGAYALWSALLDQGGAQPFPADSLIPTHQTIGALITRLSKDA